MCDYYINYGRKEFYNIETWSTTAKQNLELSPKRICSKLADEHFRTNFEDASRIPDARMSVNSSGSGVMIAETGIGILTSIFSERPVVSDV